MATTPRDVEFFAKLVDIHLDRLLPLEHNMQERVFQAARYSLLGGGKKLRPSLLLSFYTSFGLPAADAVNFASAIEMIHAYSLIHDDLPCMDDAEYRRGKLSCHMAFDYATAVLAGDALLTRAFEVMSMPSDVFPPQRILEAISVIATASGVYGMIGGQMIDFSLGGWKTSEQQLTEMVRLKTAALIAASCKAGCLLAGASRELCEAAWQYGLCIGTAFQIRDDVLDVSGEQHLLGKTTGHDFEKGKFTFAQVLGLPGCEARIASLTQEAVRYAQMFPDSALLSEIALWLTDRER